MGNGACDGLILPMTMLWISSIFKQLVSDVLVSELTEVVQIFPCAAPLHLQSAPHTNKISAINHKHYQI